MNNSEQIRSSTRATNASELHGSQDAAKARELKTGDTVVAQIVTDPHAPADASTSKRGVIVAGNFVALELPEYVAVGDPVEVKVTETSPDLKLAFVKDLKQTESPPEGGSEVYQKAIAGLLKKLDITEKNLLVLRQTLLSAPKGEVLVKATPQPPLLQSLQSYLESQQVITEKDLNRPIKLAELLRRITETPARQAGPETNTLQERENRSIVPEKQADLREIAKLAKSLIGEQVDTSATAAPRTGPVQAFQNVLSAVRQVKNAGSDLLQNSEKKIVDFFQTQREQINKSTSEKVAHFSNAVEGSPADSIVRLLNEIKLTPSSDEKINQFNQFIKAFKTSLSALTGESSTNLQLESVQNVEIKSLLKEAREKLQHDFGMPSIEQRLSSESENVSETANSTWEKLPQQTKAILKAVDAQIALVVADTDLKESQSSSASRQTLPTSSLIPHEKPIPALPDGLTKIVDTLREVLNKSVRSIGELESRIFSFVYDHSEASKGSLGAASRVQNLIQSPGSQSSLQLLLNVLDEAAKQSSADNNATDSHSDLNKDVAKFFKNVRDELRQILENKGDESTTQEKVLTLLQSTLKTIYDEYKIPPLELRIENPDSAALPGLSSINVKLLKSVEVQIRNILTNPDFSLELTPSPQSIKTILDLLNSVKFDQKERNFEQVKALERFISESKDQLKLALLPGADKTNTQSVLKDILGKLKEDFSPLLSSPQPPVVQNAPATTPQISETKRQTLQAVEALVRFVLSSAPEGAEIGTGQTPGRPAFKLPSDFLSLIAQKLSSTPEEVFSSDPLIPGPQTIPLDNKSLEVTQIKTLLARLAKIPESAHASSNEEQLQEFASETLAKIEHESLTLGGLQKNTLKQALQTIHTRFLPKDANSPSNVLHELKTDAHKQVEELLRGADDAKKLAPLMQALGEPAALIFPVLLNGMWSRIELSFGLSTSPESAMSDGKSEKEANRDLFKRILVSVPMPSMGLIQVDVAHRGKEILVNFGFENAIIKDFVATRFATLEATLKSSGYDTVHLHAEKRTSEINPASQRMSEIVDSLVGPKGTLA